MSHTTTINNVEIVDLDALRAAVDELQTNGVSCSLLENSVPRGYYAKQNGLEKAPMVLSLRNSKYDVGFYRNTQDTAYEARCDLFGGHIAREIGAGDAPMGKLMSLYATHAITRKAVQQGHRVSRVNKQDGSIQLQISMG
jgi:hypothetical protein